MNFWPRECAMRELKINILPIVAAISIALQMCSCVKASEKVDESSSGKVITHLTAPASAGSSPFDGKVDEDKDLEDLVKAAWGDARLGLHRGHAPIINVLEAFLGISHSEMHVLMEESGLNLAEICFKLGYNPDNLIESLTSSFVPYIQEGVDNAIINQEEAKAWIGRIRDEFRKRVHWNGE